MIAFESVECRRGATAVLRNVSFDVRRGETLALVGRSGSGKSTALKLINRMLTPHSGKVLVDGRDTRSWDSIQLRRQTGFVLQEVGLFPHMTVGRNVAVVPLLIGSAEEATATRARELLKLVGLDPDEFGKRWPDQLSGGQRQRVGVARALAADPPVILMDEPFGALDPVTRAELHAEFRRIQAEVKKTIVLVTHDMREAFLLADRVGVLDAGELVAWDRPDRVRDDPHPAVRVLMDAAFA